MPRYTKVGKSGFKAASRFSKTDAGMILSPLGMTTTAARYGGSRIYKSGRDIAHGRRVDSTLKHQGENFGLDMYDNFFAPRIAMGGRAYGDLKIVSTSHPSVKKLNNTIVNASRSNEAKKARKTVSHIVRKLF